MVKFKFQAGVVWIGAAALLTMPLAAVAMAERRENIPPAFLGEWNDVVSACGSNRGSGRLVIGKSRIVYPRSRGVILQILRRSTTTIDVVARYDGEEAQWIRSDRFTLSRSGKFLTADAGQDSLVRRRCNTVGAKIIRRREPHAR